MIGGAVRRVGRGLCLVLGRERTVRLGRCLEDEGRLDGPNDPRVNGERLILRWVVQRADPAVGLTVFDVGANVGLWTRELAASVLARRDLDPRRVRVVAFEPAPASWSVLRDTTAELPIDVRVEQLALSSCEGRRTLQVVAATAGVNSFYPPHGLAIERTEEVDVGTLDGFADAEDFERIDLVKIDAEGHDMAIMEGARQMLAAGRIGLVQFEYNHRWVEARRFLKDAFDLLLGFGYTLGKLTRMGWEPYPRWHPVLETYRESNFLAVEASSRGLLPRVEWWGRRRYGG